MAIANFLIGLAIGVILGIAFIVYTSIAYNRKYTAEIIKRRSTEGGKDGEEIPKS